MNNNYNKNVNSINFNDISRDTEESMYPEVYHKFMPVADQLIKEMEKKYGEIYLTDDLLNQMTDEAMRRSGMNAADPSPSDTRDMWMGNGDVMPAIYEFGRGRRGGYWRNYDRDALSDIYRILLLQQLFGRRRPYWRYR